MKLIVLALAFLGLVAYAAARPKIYEGEEYRSSGSPVTEFEHRFRRAADPQGSVVIQGTKPLSGPDRRPSLDVNYNHQFYDRNSATASAYGGLNIRPGQAPQPHVGLQAERQFKNGFIGGFGQVERGPSGRPSPTFGMKGGFRFRRDADSLWEEEEQ